MAKFCKNCGTDLNGNNTCHNCGTVNGTSKTSNNTNTPNNNSNNSNNNFNNNNNNSNFNNQNYNNGGYNYYQPSPTNGMAIAGFVLSLIGCTCILGLIFSIIGLTQAPKYNNNGKGLAIAGICISAVAIVGYIIWFFIYLAVYEGRL